MPRSERRSRGSPPGAPPQWCYVSGGRNADRPMTVVMVRCLARRVGSCTFERQRRVRIVGM
eukprot:3644541-Pleurochrysis_carterae.AAC.5